MENFAGTKISLIVRLLQVVCATASFAIMFTTKVEIMRLIAFRYLIAAMIIQTIWSTAMACMDAYAVATKRILYDLRLFSLIALMDSVTAILSITAASSAAALNIHLYSDMKFHVEDNMKYQIAIALAFMTWAMVRVCGLIMTYLLFDRL